MFFSTRDLPTRCLNTWQASKALLPIGNIPMVVFALKLLEKAQFDGG
jgi:NDP-sugar pyrophosphorylase family protein